MHYVISVLAAILVGTSIGAILGPRNNLLLIGSLIAAALGVFAIFTASWIPLAVGTVVCLATQAVQRDTPSVQA